MSTIGLSQESSKTHFESFLGCCTVRLVSDPTVRFIRHQKQTLELNKSIKGYDAGYIKDQYGCNSNKCECAHFSRVIIGKLKFY